MAAIAAAAASAANTAMANASSSNQSSSDSFDARSQKNVQMDLLQQTLQNQSKFKMNTSSDSLNRANKLNTSATNIKKLNYQLDETFDPNKKQKSRKDPLNSIADGETKQGEFQSKIKSRHHHHMKRQLHQKLSQKSPQQNIMDLVPPQVILSNSLSSFSSNVSNSSSSISSDSNSSSIPSPPPLSSVKHFSSTKADLDTKNSNHGLLQQSKSVPKIAVKNSSAKDESSSLRPIFPCVHKSSENINPNKLSSKFIPPSLAALNTNSPFNNNNNAQNRASSEVKLKLKNAILQKLDRNKLAKSNSDINVKNKDKATSLNVTRSHSNLHDTQNHFKQKFQSDMSFKNSNLNNINENKMINQQHIQQHWLKNAVGKFLFFY